MKSLEQDYFKQWYQKNKDRLKPLRKEYLKKYWLENPEKSLLRLAKARAKRKGWDFNIDETDIVIPEICPALGVKLERFTQYAPSIDRKDSSKGYVKGNIQVISELANRMKSNASPKDLESFAKWLLSTHS